MNNIYEDIARRTQGDIYVGVVGPVRTGKSTFIRKFMELLVLPNIENEFKRERTQDEIPQSGSGKTIMTVEPKFVPADGVEIKIRENVSMKVRMVDCVGYIVDGVLGHEEDGKQRLVSTPWSNEAMTFEKAAEIGTKKVIRDHSTIGIVMTTDGSITEIDRKSYSIPEERVINELKELKKPFVIVLNTLDPYAESTLELKRELEEKYDKPVIPLNVLAMDEEDVEEVMENVLYDFPINEININFPKWIEGLEKNHWIKNNIICAIKDSIDEVGVIRDVNSIIDGFENLDFLDETQVDNVELGEGIVSINLGTKKDLFYNVLEEKSGFKIDGEYELLNLVTRLSKVNTEYEKVEQALTDVREKGYGLVAPTIDELTLDVPEIVKQGKQYGVRLRAKAGSIHMIKADISTEISPGVGTEQQGKEMLESLLKGFEENPNEIWEYNMFGKSLHDLVKDQLQSKLYMMPDDVRIKIQKTLQKIINDGCSNIITIIL
ncbi:stage IV sporulation protein A [Paraclostridium bifermentans]|uniref:stage IV sporulation protein A n=1 Tax=Paraclostridium bifermentans TaxID=1490 RepID=UPI001FF57678|nr:stage IV sporulation protein A [Paraclostridium bifermentans]UOW67421.1 stage IV sporulation protein A [Paraclostridium bifermentans]